MLSGAGAPQVECHAEANPAFDARELIRAWIYGSGNGIGVPEVAPVGDEVFELGAEPQPLATEVPIRRLPQGTESGRILEGSGHPADRVASIEEWTIQSRRPRRDKD